MAKISVSRVLLTAAGAAADEWFQATTTNFDGYQGSCGGCLLGMFQNVPGWATVATAEAMQIPYACKECPDCHCATGDAQRARGGAPGGCGQCYEVQTTGTNPYGEELPVVAFNATVADSCPYGPNQEWCARNVGDTNQHGFEYHIDVYNPDHAKLGIGNNPIVQFRPIDCPPEILELQQQKCCDQWYPGQGCNSICPQDSCPPGEGPGPSPSPPPSPTPSPAPSSTYKCIGGQCAPATGGVDQATCEAVCSSSSSTFV